MFISVLLTFSVPQAAQATPVGQRLRDLAAKRGLLIGFAPGFGAVNDPVQAPVIAAEANIFTPENNLKWFCIHPQQNVYDWNRNDPYSCSSADADVKFANDHGMIMHGHVLVWHEGLPAWVMSMSLDQLESVMNDHIDTVVGRYNGSNLAIGRVHVWDVVNEAVTCNGSTCGYRDSIWKQAMGVGSDGVPLFIPKAFQRTHAADPNAVLLYNDGALGEGKPHADFVYNEVKKWLAAGVPINGVGFQMHIDTDFNQFAAFSADLQRFGKLGLDVYITELDVMIPPYQNSQRYTQQAAIYKELMKRCLAQTHCKSFQTWGWTDRWTWLNDSTYGGWPGSDPLLFNECFQPKPAYYAVQEALGGSHPATLMLQAEAYNQGQGVQGAPDAEFLYYVTDGAWIQFNNVNLGSGFTTLKTCYAKGSSDPGSVEVHLGSMTGSIIASFNTQDTGGWNNFQEQATPLTGGTGNQTLVVKFIGSATGNFDDFLLESTQSTPGPFTLQAEKYDEQQGVETYPTFIGFVDNGDWIKFNNVNLGNGFGRLRVGYAKGNKTKTRIEVHVGSLTGPKIAELKTTSTGGWNTFKEKTTPIKGGAGVQTLYFVFAGGDGVGNMDYFTFENPRVTASAVNSAAAAETDNTVDDTSEDAESTSAPSYTIYLPAVSR
ncbi:MAG: endo-1,4-beta-xylanase [Caldilineaceae bacterium]